MDAIIFAIKFFIKRAFVYLLLVTIGGLFLSSMLGSYSHSLITVYIYIVAIVVGVYPSDDDI